MLRTRGDQSISAIRYSIEWSGCLGGVTVIIAFLCILAYGECPWPWLHHMIYGIKVDQKCTGMSRGFSRGVKVVLGWDGFSGQS